MSTITNSPLPQLQTPTTPSFLRRVLLHIAPNNTNITILYIASLMMIAALSLGGQLLVQNELRKQSDDALVVNIAGRQRMLSQRISKTALALQLSEDNSAWRDELAFVMAQWQVAHAGLQSGGEIAVQNTRATLARPVVLPGSNSESIAALFAGVEPSYASIVAAAEAILDEDSSADIPPHIQTILQNEPVFLDGMERIVFQYNLEANNRVTTLRILEGVLLIIMLGVLVLEGLLIFRPAVRRIDKTLNALRLMRADLTNRDARYQALVERSHDLIFHIAHDGSFTFVNQTWLNTLGYTREEAATLRLTDILASEHKQFARIMFNRALRGKTYENVQTTFVSKQGALIEVEGDITPEQHDSDVIAAQALLRNISRRKQVETELRESNSRLQDLSRRVVKIQEEERRHLARELHDEIGQRLTATKMQLLTASRLAPTQAVEKQLEQAMKTVTGTLKQVRTLSLDLHPSLLDDVGLVATLRWYLDQQSQWGNFTTHLESNLTTRLPRSIELVCFRVVQESLTNIARHAAAKQVNVAVNQLGNKIDLVIEDNGVGFDVRHALSKGSQGRSLGLRGMEERVALAGGQLSIKSWLGKGARIRLTMPVRPLVLPEGAQHG